MVPSIGGTYQYFDEYGMCVIKGDDISWRDAIGRTVMYLYAYGPAETGLGDCYRGGKLYRHPAHGELSSRDHWAYYVMYKPQIVNKRGLFLWSRALCGNKFCAWLWYKTQIIGAHVGTKWNRFVYLLAGQPFVEYPNDWWATNGVTYQSQLSSYQKWLRQFIVPTYSLHIKGWQLYHLPASKHKSSLQKVLRGYLPKNCCNYVLKLLFGAHVTQAEVMGYRHMSSWRWGVFLNWSTSRHLVYADGVLEVGVLKRLYNDN